MATLSNDSALALIQAAGRSAREIGKPFSITVVDRSGLVLAASRMDGAALTTLSLSRDKAVTALAVSAGTGAWQGRLIETFGAAGPALFAAASPELVPLPGGVPIVVGGQIVGSIGVSGGVADEDVAVARSALASVESGLS
ncbi:heme-binding protein [Microbacterium sp. NPDC058062]|uniref:GlcG/HbpS family heme-binding protein n=1 Tax=Microbacterium sp. NPDC058062 TaxID=3346320 RepID=UPI0036DC914E